MANNVGEGFYHNSLSRKELQSLCKKYGLPANRSSSDMAISLASYLEKQRLGSMTAEQRLYVSQEVGLPLSLKPQLQLGTLWNSSRDDGQDCYGLVSCPRDRCNGGNYSHTIKFNAFDCCTGNKLYHKDGYGGGSISSSNEAACRSCLNTTSGSPSFQFHVSSEEGINLYVDLNSNPSEWVEKLKSEVSIGQKAQNMSHSKSKAHPDTQEYIFSDGTSSAERGCLMTLDSNISSPMKRQNSQLEHKICENATLQNGCNPVSLGEIIPRSLPDSSLQMTMAKDVVHQMDALHSSYENGEAVDLVDLKHDIYAKQGGLVGSAELDHQVSFRSGLPAVVNKQTLFLFQKQLRRL